MLSADLQLLAIVCVPFASVPLALCVGRLAGRWTGILMPVAAAVSFAGCLHLAIHGETVQWVRQWVPGLHVMLSFRGDSFGLFFASLISGIGILVGVYSIQYLPPLAGARLGRYYATLLAFMGAMLGVALADDLMLLFVCWEITSLTSFLLIGFWYEQEAARQAAITALLVTALGGLALLVGFLMLGMTGGTFSLRTLLEQPLVRDRITHSALFVPALILILIGALTKSAQWPFHFWLPGAMVAPTPVSAYLHAATMVKAGIFLLGRFLPIFHTSAVWAGILVPIGLATFLLGAMTALVETDLKGMLAKTTVATLGLLTLLYGLELASQDALQILAHATYKGALFLVVGIVEHVTHTRDTRQLGGLSTKLPLTFAVCVLASWSLAGIWPSLGFFAKETLYAELLRGNLSSGWVPAWLVLPGTVLANACLFAVACRLACGVFLGTATSHVQHVGERGRALLWAPALLAVLTVGFGLLAPWTGRAAQRFSSVPGTAVHLSLVPALSGPVLLSALTLVMGLAIYRWGPALQPGNRPGWFSAQRLWDQGLTTLTGIAVRFSVRWQSGSLRWYLAGSLTFAVALFTLALQRVGRAALMVPIQFHELTWYGFTLCAMLGFTAILVARSNTRVAAAIALTSNGFVTALLYVVYRSPDILLTQILIETVSTIFLLLVLYYLPPFRPEPVRTRRRLGNLAVAVAVGAMMFSCIVLSTSVPFREVRNLGLEYLTRSMAQAGGANAVNVIIVDFRAIDTNGEITVLVLVGLLIYGLLRTRRPLA